VPKPTKSKSSEKKPARSKAPREIEIKPDRKSAPLIPLRAPIRLDAVLGQQRAIAELRAAIASDRIHHSWVFHGPVGVGKFTTALAFAAVILDATSQAALSGRIEPDPSSYTQRLLASGTHPDLHIITKELVAISRVPELRDAKQRNIAKEVLEEFLIEPATKTRSSADRAMASKVFIVDEAELIDAKGQNSLLKTLEEPPSGSVIILVTAHEERLLPTIRSRSQPVAFAPLGDDDMKKWMSAAKLDLSGLNADGKSWLLSFAAGSPGAAQLAVQTGLPAWHASMAPLLTELDAGRFPIDFASTASKLIDEWAQAWIDRPGSENASKDAANKAAARLMFRLLNEHFRSRLRALAGTEGKQDRLLSAIDLIKEAEWKLDANVQGLFVLDDLATSLANTTG
jgi:hypothetical protein